MPTSTIITVLKTDHRAVAALLKSLEETTERNAKKRQELFSELDSELSVHADFEEERVYPLLKQEKDSKDIALEAVEEHLQVKRLLAELRTLDPQEETWKAKLTVLAENVRHHVKEEESEALPALKKQVDEQELVALAQAYQERKAALIADAK